jgi:hypothetical protein
MLSPDGKWVWDGRQWLPVARHEAVFPAWSVVTVEHAEAAHQVAAPAPAPEPIPEIGDEPEAEETVNYYVQADSSKPAWERTSLGLNRYMYVAIGVVVLLVISIALASMGPIQLPWMASSTVTPRPSPTPPITFRSDYALADRFLNGFVAPAMANLNQSQTIVNEVCNGLLSLSCRDDMTDTDRQVKNVILVIDRQTVATCIAGPVARMKLDLTSMDTGLHLALQGYGDNKASELAQGLAGYRSAAQTLVVDRAAAASAQKAVCNTQLSGP